MIKIRKLKKGDLDFVLNLFRELDDNTTGINDEWEIYEILNMINNYKDLNLGAFLDGKLIGFVLSHCYTRANKVYVENIVVSKEHRRKGVASALLCELHFLYSKLGNYRFIALVNENNISSCALFKKFYMSGNKMIWYQRKKEK